MKEDINNNIDTKNTFICFFHLDDFELCLCEANKVKRGNVKRMVDMFENYSWAWK